MPGYVLDVQADLLDSLNTGVVVPLLPLADAPTLAKRLNPVFEISIEPHVMVTQFLTAIPSALVRSPVITLEDRDSEIMVALDIALVDF